MSGHGKTVRIYLADGSPAGIRHAEVVNWTGQAIVCPRGRIGELSKWPESQRPGLYILIGEDPETSRPLAYIGEAENVLVRLKQHVGSKDFWDQVVFFTSKDENLTKAHVKYLESRVVQLATAANRIDLANGTSPTQSTLPRPDRDAMEEFLEPARILLGALGFTLLEPVRSRKEGDVSNGDNGPLSHITLYLKMPRFDIEAEGISTDEGFIVTEDSIGSGKVWESLSKGKVKQRADLLQEGAIVESGEHIRFTRDVLFNSPSAASELVCGASGSGRTYWKDKNGTTLRDLENALAGVTTEPDGDA
jgi:hypothetical protein